MKTKNLLLEIGTEELPSTCINEGVLSLEKNIVEKFGKNRLGFKDIKTFGTPRRLVAIVEGLNESQSPSQKTVLGPPKKIAFDDKGLPNQAAIGFAKSLGIKIDELEFKETDKGEYLCKKIAEKEEEAKKILPEILTDVITSIIFSVQMTWADWQVKFARPIRWLLAIFGNEVLKFGIESIESAEFTYGLRLLSEPKIKVEKADNYLDLLGQRGKVVLDQQKRKEIILEGIKSYEKDKKFKQSVIINPELLEEVINLVEHPNVLSGSFPDSFLILPDEILVKAIEYHQRYFAIKDNENKIIPNFIVVQNGLEDEDGSVIKGNERVLKARLSDASFFYSEDKKHTWESWEEKLKGVIFYSGLGTIFDKQQRLEKICLFILNQLKQNGTENIKALENNCMRAARLCKTDLVTNLVVEFPELQGVVGREYAKERNEEIEVSEAIFEHYLPRFLGDILPKTFTGTVLSLADKLDTITGMFLAENIPTGSEDPFALRRRATGIVQSLIDKKLGINLEDIIDYTLSLYACFDIYKEQDASKKTQDIFLFIIARLKFIYEKNKKRTDLIDAIIKSGSRSLKDIILRYDAIDEVMLEGAFDDIATPMTRCKNILKNREISEIKQEFLTDKAEKTLYSALIEKKEIINKFNKSEKYKNSLKELAELRKTVDSFFDEVLIMDKNEAVRNNRINLVGGILDLYLSIADFSEITN